MTKNRDFSKLEADLSEVNKVERKNMTILFATDLREAVEEAYGKGNIGKILEAGALMKLRRDGHIPETPRGAEPANMESYVKAKKVEKVALDEIKERAAKEAPTKPKKR